MKTVTMNTAELVGNALDWAVAQAIGKDVAVSRQYADGGRRVVVWYHHGRNGIDGRSYCPSEHWSDGGPLLKEYAIGFVGIATQSGGAWRAFSSPEDKSYEGIGPDHLVAACRLVVGAELGETVEVPEQLVQAVAS